MKFYQRLKYIYTSEDEQSYVWKLKFKEKKKNVVLFIRHKVFIIYDNYLLFLFNFVFFIA